MSHDIWASFITAELTRHFNARPSDCFLHPPAPATLSIFVGGRTRAKWPFEDGVIVLESGATKYDIAVEFKRQNEGTHGMLTALGQSLAYIHKGHSGSVIVIPKQYSSHLNPGSYMKEVLDNAVSKPTVGVFAYDEPDTTQTLPFAGKIQCLRKLEVDSSVPTSATVSAGIAETQWMHVREGSSTPSAFFRYLQTAKILAANNESPINLALPPGLEQAIQRLQPGADPVKYLSYSVENNLHNEVWRHFWFKYIFVPELIPIWTPGIQPYQVNEATTRLLQADGTKPMKMFSGRSDSIKSTLVRLLNAEVITEDVAWQRYAENVHGRAHSYREDIDSGLEGMGLLESDGRASDLGYRFVDACERTGNPHTGSPRLILGTALLNTGEMGALLHYIYRLSEKKFRATPLAYYNIRTRKFDINAYRDWLEDELANNLKVMRKVSARGGVARKPLQSEFTILRKYDFVSGFRAGVGLEINWPAVQEATAFPI